MNNKRGVDLRVHLDNSMATFKPGDVIKGMVLVKVEHNINCKQLEVKNGYKLYGKGDTDSKDMASLILYQGQWRAGRYKYPFTFTVPDQDSTELPSSYHGHYIDLTWQITAKASLNLIASSKAQTRYQIHNPPSYLLEVDENINKSSNFFEYVFVVAMVSTPFLMAVATISNGILSLSFFLVLLSDILVVIIILVIVRTIFSFITRAHPNKFGKMQLSAFAAPIDNTINANLDITTKRNIKVSRLTAYLVFVESATSGFGSSSTTYTKQRVLSKFVMNRKLVTLAKNKTNTFAIRLEVPEPLTVNIYHLSNQINYKIMITAQVDNDEPEYEWHCDLNMV